MSGIRKTITPQSGEYEFPGENGHRFEKALNDEHDPSHDLDPDHDDIARPLTDDFPRN